MFNDNKSHYRTPFRKISNRKPTNKTSRLGVWFINTPVPLFLKKVFAKTEQYEIRHETITPKVVSRFTLEPTFTRSKIRMVRRLHPSFRPTQIGVQFYSVWYDKTDSKSSSRTYPRKVSKTLDLTKGVKTLRTKNNKTD